MQLATLRFKLTMEDAKDEFMDSFYGLGYIFTTILNCNDIDKDEFLSKAEIVAGTVDNKDSVWLSYDGWYIIADGLSMIRLSEIAHSDFEAVGTMSARDLYDHNFMFREAETKQSKKKAKMS